MANGKQTSDRLSSLAASILTMNDFEIKLKVSASDVRSLAASVLTQDETKGKNDEASKD